MAADKPRGNEPQETIAAEETVLNAKNAQTKTEEKRNFQQNVLFFFRNVTLEPTAMLFIIAYFLNGLTTQNLSLEKACRVNLNFTDEICTAMREQTLDSQNPYEREAQRLVTTAITWKTYITAIVPCLIGLFVGPWSDKTGHRKMILLSPITGQALCCINNMLQTYFFYQLNLETLIYVDAAIEALSGGMGVMVATIFAFIAALTSTETRTFRMGMVSFSLTVAISIGSAVSGVTLRSLGYYGSYGIAMSLHVLNLLYTIFVLKDPPRTSEQKTHNRRGAAHFFRTFFDLSNIKDAMKVVFIDGTKRRRVKICILLVVVTFLYGPMYGESTVLYMSTRYRFNWDEVRYSIFQTYNTVINTVGTMFSITVLSRYLQWHDSLLGITSSVSKISAAFIFCFAPNDRIFFIGPAVDILNGTALLAIKSIASKLVSSNELGKMYSIFGITENLTPLIYVPLYTYVYRTTMDIFPGAIFLMGAALTMPALCVFVWLFMEHRSNLNGKQLKNSNDNILAEK